MEITLSEKQLEIIKSAINEQDQIKTLANTELAKVQKTIDSVVSVLLDINNLGTPKTVQLKENKLIFEFEEEVQKEVITT